MGTVRCSDCNHEYPERNNLSVCIMCGGPIGVTDPGMYRCAICGRQKTKSQFKWIGRLGRYAIGCNQCTSEKSAAKHPETKYKYRRLWYKKFKMVAAEKHADILRGLSNNSKVLSELDWYKTCDYFGGCAFCGDEAIETRVFLNPVKHGGKYACLNMLPACGKCSVTLSNARSVVARLASNRNRLHNLTPEREAKIYAFIKEFSDV